MGRLLFPGAASLTMLRSSVLLVLVALVALCAHVLGGGVACTDDGDCQADDTCGATCDMSGMCDFSSPPSVDCTALDVDDMCGHTCVGMMCDTSSVQDCTVQGTDTDCGLSCASGACDPGSGPNCISSNQICSTGTCVNVPGISEPSSGAILYMYQVFSTTTTSQERTPSRSSLITSTLPLRTKSR